MTSVTGAPDFSRRALINWSWLEGGADEEEEAKDRERHRRRSSSSRDDDDDDDDNKELEETQRRQRKAELLLSFNAPEKEAEVETWFSVSARAAERATRAREERLMSPSFGEKKSRERKRCDFFSSFHIFFTFSDASDLACCSAPVPRAYLLSLDVLFSHGAQLDVFVILKSAQV